jgi:hypothetical protein
MALRAYHWRCWLNALAVLDSILCALKLPSGIAARVEMVFVYFGRYAVSPELCLQLHLSPPQYLAADRARLTAPGTAHRAVRPSRRQLSVLDRFAGFVAEDALVHRRHPNHLYTKVTTEYAKQSSVHCNPHQGIT